MVLPESEKSTTFSYRWMMRKKKKDQSASFHLFAGNLRFWKRFRRSWKQMWSSWVADAMAARRETKLCLFRDEARCWIRCACRSWCESQDVGDCLDEVCVQKSRTPTRRGERCLSDLCFTIDIRLGATALIFPNLKPVETSVCVGIGVVEQ